MEQNVRFKLCSLVDCSVYIYKNLVWNLKALMNFAAAHMLGWFRVRLHQSVRLFISDKQSRLARILRARIFMLILSSNRTLGHVTVMHSIFILQCQSVSSFFSLLLIRIIVFVTFSSRLSPRLVDQFSLVRRTCLIPWIIERFVHRDMHQLI